MMRLLAKRKRERKAAKLVHDRERLAKLEPGGSAERPIQVTSAAVVEVRAHAMPCPQCAGELKVREHSAPASGLRKVRVTCNQCSVSRDLWFRLVSDEPN